jgi:hypothetical protein
MFRSDACVTLEGARFKSFEDLEFQEQELKTLNSYSLKEREVFPWSFFYPNNHNKYNFFYMHACVLILMGPN